VTQLRTPSNGVSLFSGAVVTNLRTSAIKCLQEDQEIKRSRDKGIKGSNAK
jgi:hypothetical protein